MMKTIALTFFFDVTNKPNNFSGQNLRLKNMVRRENSKSALKPNHNLNFRCG